jgi:hypothetical protein
VFADVRRCSPMFVGVRRCSYMSVRVRTSLAMVVEIGDGEGSKGGGPAMS